jgi:two-component system, cell cycle sensor histidine kinase and response regulator CckA
VAAPAWVTTFRARAGRLLARAPATEETLWDPGQGDLGQAERLFQTLRPVFEESGALVVVTDRAGRLRLVNRALRAVLGTACPPLGESVALLIDEARRTESWNALVAILTGRMRPGTLSAVLCCEGGGEGHAVNIAVTVLRGPRHEVDGLLLTLTDLTQQREREAQAVQNQKLQAVGQLAGGIAHDFNNLLTAILGATEEILGRPALDPAVEEEARRIRTSADRGAALVRQLLAFGRQQALQPRVVALNEAVSDLAGLLERVLGGGVRLSLALEEPGRQILVDPTQLDQVVINLAVNARNAMPEGGDLTLSTGHLTLLAPLARGAEIIPPGRYVTLDVRDTGCGIPPEVLPRIFEPFFTTRREGGGTGLGLSTVHGIVRQSGGFIAVETERGRGTCFRLYFPRFSGAADLSAPRAAPVAAPFPAVLESASSSAPAAGVARAVLLVDDEEPVRRLAERALTRRGWTVLAAETGEEALEIACGEGAPPLALVISDMVMPGMEGLTLVRALREAWPGLPAILVSGYAEAAIGRDLAAEGVAFVTKPYALKDLLAFAEQVAASSAPAQAQASAPAA